MARFKATQMSTLPSIAEPMNEAAVHWKLSLEEAKVVKEFSAINSIELNNEHNLMVTSVNRIAIYEYYSLEVKKTFSVPNFAPLYNATYRKSDYKLIVSGSSDGCVRVWDITNSKPLRALGERRNTKHTAPVRRCLFFGVSQIASFADDKRIKLWDIADESVQLTFGDDYAHDDCIRAAYVLPNLSMVISGSYDNTVKIWDIRTPQKAVHQLKHGSHVNSLTVRNLLAISGGGHTVNVYDIVAGKVMKTMNDAHNKVITCVYNHDSYLLTCSVDGYVKVYDSNFSIVASLSYAPSEIISGAFDDKLLAIGSIDGLLSVKKFKSKDEHIQLTETNRRNRYFPRKTDGDELARTEYEPLKSDIIVKSDKPKGPFLKKHDKHLKEFNYTAALNSVMRSKSSDPEVVISLMQELIRRGGLRAALAGRDDKNLKPIVDLIINHIQNPKFNRILVDVTIILIELYTPHINRSSLIKEMFKRLDSVVNSELCTLQQMMIVSGQINSIINHSVK